jgi:arylsulfatase A-like enzyme
MSLHFSAPHWPWEGPEDQAESKRIGSELNHRDGGSAATYRIMVEAMDAQIGRVLKALADTGQARDTVVVFTSDNGGERFSNTWPFSGKKMDLLEGGLRVPAVVRWPARIKRGLVSGQTMIHMDWVATLLEAAGATPDPAAPLDGISLMPVLTAGAAAKPRTLYWRFKGNAQRAIREGDYKALKVGSNSFLFNVVDDPQERANLKKRQPEVYKRLTGAWDAWNRGMLPEDPATLTGNNTAANWVDRAGAAAVAREAIDDFGPWPD